MTRDIGRGQAASLNPGEPWGLGSKAQAQSVHALLWESSQDGGGFPLPGHSAVTYSLDPFSGLLALVGCVVSPVEKS